MSEGVEVQYFTVVKCASQVRIVVVEINPSYVRLLEVTHQRVVLLVDVSCDVQVV